MDIPNLSTQPPLVSPQSKINPLLIVIIAFIAIAGGFWLSRLVPSSGSSGSSISLLPKKEIVSTDSISSSEQLKVGMVYGNTDPKFKDTATGVIEKGNINGEGTHILNREGGATQRASLISSAVDLDLFVGKKVEVKGETNASTKTSWLLDVGNIKILE